MPSDEDGGADAQRTPTDAFALFSHELRVEILDTLWAADRHALPYSEIKQRVGERDCSGALPSPASVLSVRALSVLGSRRRPGRSWTALRDRPPSDAQYRLPTV